MPFCPTGQVFLLDYNVVIFAPKLVDKIFIGPKKKMENSLERKKKNLCKIFFENTPNSDRSRISTRMQRHHFCTKTSREYIQWSQKQVENYIKKNKKNKK